MCLATIDCAAPIEPIYYLGSSLALRENACLAKVGIERNAVVKFRSSMQIPHTTYTLREGLGIAYNLLMGVATKAS